jgi:hypothetical protein
MRLFTPTYLYHRGHKPIPLYLRLASLGWEFLQSQKAAA